jgi:SAM-dependent methyltransferase
MEIEDLKYNWEVLGEQDPMWAILSDPKMKGGKWDVSEFFATGVSDIAGFLGAAKHLGLEIPRGAALDFGCGMGRMTQALCPHFASVTGCDLSESMIRQANAHNRYPEKCTYHLNTEPNLRHFADGQFDFCITFLVLQHMRPAYAMSYLEELCRVLGPKGVLLFQIPTAPTNPETMPPPPDPSAPAPRGPVGVIEMYATPLHEVVSVLAAQNLNVIAARSDGRAGAEFFSHEIWALKRG